MTVDKNLFLVEDVLFSNTKYFDVEAMNFFNSVIGEGYLDAEENATKFNGENNAYYNLNAINFLTSINNLLTLILSNAEALFCKVF